MRAICVEGFEKPERVVAGAAPILRWLAVADLVIDPTYHPPLVGRSRRKVNLIAHAFSWSCFTPVMVAPLQGGKFAIIDGQHRTAAAALAGFDSVPCQIVIADREAQAAACKTINNTCQPISRMALHAAAIGASEKWAVQLVEICARAEVELLHYPVPVDRQSPGQTMAIGAVAQCLKRYGESTLITALQCVTQTTNNRPGVLSARMIKALCAVLDGNKECRDSGLALLEAFDGIDLLALQDAAEREAVGKKINPVQALADAIRAELAPQLPCKSAATNAASANARSAKALPINTLFADGKSADPKIRAQIRARRARRARQSQPL